MNTAVYMTNTILISKILTKHSTFYGHKLERIKSTDALHRAHALVFKMFSRPVAGNSRICRLSRDSLLTNNDNGIT